MSALPFCCPALVATVVRQYLVDSGFRSSLAQFEAEAAGLLARTGDLQHRDGIKSLQSILVEYAVLWEKQQRMDAFISGSPVAAEISAVLNRHARFLSDNQQVRPRIYFALGSSDA